MSNNNMPFPKKRKFESSDENLKNKQIKQKSDVVVKYCMMCGNCFEEDNNICNIFCYICEKNYKDFMKHDYDIDV
jgi:hypothetical protein